jgi:hypothetical protein
LEPQDQSSKIAFSSGASNTFPFPSLPFPSLPFRAFSTYPQGVREPYFAKLYKPKCQKSISFVVQKVIFSFFFFLAQSCHCLFTLSLSNLTNNEPMEEYVREPQFGNSHLKH